jgi:hypothetical protein
MPRSSSRRRFFETSASMEVESPDAVVARLRDPATWPAWQSEITQAEGPAPLQPGDHVSGDARMLGFAVGGRADVVAAGGTEVEHDVIVGIRMNVRYTIDRTGDAVVLTHRLTAELPRGLAGRILAVFLKRRLQRMQRRLLSDLAIELGRAGRPRAARRGRATKST